MTKSSKRQTRIFQFFCSSGNIFLFSPRQKQIAKRKCRTRVKQYTLLHGSIRRLMRNIEKRVVTNALEDWHFVQRNKQHSCLHSKRNTSLFWQHCINKVMLGRSMEEWKYRKQVSSRKKSLFIRINLQVVLTFWQTWRESNLDSPRIITTRQSEHDVSGEINVTFSTQILPVLILHCWMKDGWI